MVTSLPSFLKRHPNVSLSRVTIHQIKLQQLSVMKNITISFLLQSKATNISGKNISNKKQTCRVSGASREMASDASLLWIMTAMCAGWGIGGGIRSFSGTLQPLTVKTFEE